MKKPSADRASWMARLSPLRRTPQPQPVGAYAIPPSRANKKVLTTWQDIAALKQLKHLANDLGVSQQSLVAEGINHVLAKHGKLPVAT